MVGMLETPQPFLSPVPLNVNIAAGGAITIAMANPGSAPSVSRNPGGGTIPQQTTYYKYSAIDALGGETLPSPEVSIANQLNDSNTLTLTAVAGASSYRVYRGTTIGGENVYFSTASPSFTDTGAAGTAGTPVAVSTAFAVKLSGSATSQGAVTLGASNPPTDNTTALGSSTGPLRWTNFFMTGSIFGGGGTPVPNSQSLAGSGTYTTPTNANGDRARYLQVIGVGGGGGGGASSAGSLPGTGGSAGGAFIDYITSPAVSYAYGVGAGGGSATVGGNTTFGTRTANGGMAGVSSSASNGGVGGGTASGGLINITGGAGGPSGASGLYGGIGGNSVFGGGGQGANNGAGGNGSSGGGGGGAAGAANSGGSGGTGVILVVAFF